MNSWWDITWPTSSRDQRIVIFRFCFSKFFEPESWENHWFCYRFVFSFHYPERFRMTVSVKGIGNSLRKIQYNRRIEIFSEYCWFLVRFLIQNIRVRRLVETFRFSSLQYADIICFFAATGIWPHFPQYMQNSVNEMGQQIFSQSDEHIRNFCRGKFLLNAQTFRPGMLA